MNLVLIAKIVGPFVVLSSAALAAVGITNPKRLGLYPYVNVLAISENISDTATGFSNDNVNYKCQFESTTVLFDCKISKWTANDTNNTEKKYKFSDLGKYLHKSISDSDLTTENKIFQIKFKKSEWSPEDSTKKIEIVSTSTEQSNKDKKFAKLTQLVSDYEGEQTGKTEYFVAEATTLKGTIESTSSWKCFLGEETEEKTCQIFDLLKSSVFSKPESTQSTTITKNSFYLIQFTGTNDKQEIKDFSHKIITYKASTSETTNVATFGDIKPAIYSSSTGNADYIFIVE